MTHSLDSAQLSQFAIEITFLNLALLDTILFTPAFATTTASTINEYIDVQFFLQLIILKKKMARKS